jgi:hypothetical protein
VEINEDIPSAVNVRFGDFTGHLDKHPRVTFVNDEARSYVARHRLPISFRSRPLTRASRPQAFIPENSLYTVEAWHIFLERLNDTGLTFSCWYFRDRPGEMYRLTSLASALREAGIQNPASTLPSFAMRGGRRVEALGRSSSVKHRCQSRCGHRSRSPATGSWKSSTPFALRCHFRSHCLGAGSELICGPLPHHRAPTDDSPFFQHARLRTFHSESLDQGQMSMNMRASSYWRSGRHAWETLLCIIGPLILTTARTEVRGAVPLFIFFAGIGLGFMLIEISQMQRLIVFLGHPTYSLSVVLFALLLSSGVGSHLTQRVEASRFRSSALMLLSSLLAVLVVFGVSTPHAISFFQGSTTSLRMSWRQ